jgi:hypothetical protein
VQGKNNQQIQIFHHNRRLLSKELKEKILERNFNEELIYLEWIRMEFHVQIKVEANVCMG